MKKPKYRMANVHMESNGVVYCQLVEQKSNTVEIQATLDYVLFAIRDRGLRVENVVVEGETVRIVDSEKQAVREAHLLNINTLKQLIVVLEAKIAVLRDRIKTLKLGSKSS